MQKILVPVDGSLHAHKALLIAIDLAEKYGGAIALLHVLAVGRTANDILKLSVAKSFPDNMIDDLKNMSKPLSVQQLTFIGEKILQEAELKAQRRGVQVKVLALGEGDPVEAILLAARVEAANTIIMGCRGVSVPKQQGGEDEMQPSMGSVSNSVFARAECTCISVK